MPSNIESRVKRPSVNRIRELLQIAWAAVASWRRAAPLSPCGRGVGGEGLAALAKSRSRSTAFDGKIILHVGPPPHPRPLSRKGRGEQKLRRRRLGLTCPSAAAASCNAAFPGPTPNQRRECRRLFDP